ncbi:MAG: hypothetical protein E7E21_11040 [Peptostreptococcaceae bacterium]|nr:hypothetical protein [Peptostreptococcaceae bacterium]
MIANKIKPKVKKVIDKFPTYVDIYRNSKNEFGEPGGKELIYENLKGFYHEGNTQINFSIADKGEVKRSNQKFLMVIYDEETVKIQENDYFMLDNKKYIIKDLGNQNRLNIYFDMLLEVN